MQFEKLLTEEYKPLFKFSAFKKHHQEKSYYQIKMMQDNLHFYSQSNSIKPKYNLKIELNTTIRWITKESKFIGLQFSENGSKYKFYAESEDIQNVRSYLSNKVVYGDINNMYESMGQLGEGMSAKVILVRQMLNRLKYAAKQISREFIDSQEFGMKTFKQEIEILRKISNPFINNQKFFINLHEIYIEENNYYLILDYLEGETLYDVMRKINKKHLGHTEFIQMIMRQLLMGVAILHENGIIHRDLKPENLMFSKSGEYKSTLRIVDFGLATETNVDKFLHPRCGSPGYVAPEILRLKDTSEKYDSICDVFSCGSIFYELITGQFLFNGLSTSEILYLNKKCDVAEKLSVIKRKNFLAYDLMKQMLAKNPINRISAQQALEHGYFVQMSISNALTTNPKSTVTDILQQSKMTINNSSNEIFLKNNRLISQESQKNNSEDSVSICSQQKDINYLDEFLSQKDQIKIVPKLQKPVFYLGGEKLIKYANVKKFTIDYRSMRDTSPLQKSYRSISQDFSLSSQSSCCSSMHTFYISDSKDGRVQIKKSTNIESDQLTRFQKNQDARARQRVSQFSRYQKKKSWLSNFLRLF